MQWARIGATTPSGHVETDFLAEADTEADALAVVASLSLSEVRAALFAAVAERTSGTPARRWWDAMHDESGDAGPGGTG